MTSPRYISKVAIVGAGGNSGSFITQELLKTGKHSITAITRLDSQTKLPAGVTVKKVDYNKHETLVEALTGQDALVITLGGHAVMQQIEEKIVRAAAEAGVPWIFPNEWSPDTANEALVKDVFIFKAKVTTRNLIEELGNTSYVGISTGFWYEWSLGSPKCFGLDFAKKSAIFFDDGETRICTSTWSQVGRAVAALLSLPTHHSDNAEQGPALEDYRNKVVYINSFTISQRDMLDSALRVTGTDETEWTITKESAKERWNVAAAGMKEGKYEHAPAFLYTRVFFKDGSGDFEQSKGTLNSLLRLPKEDLDEATSRALERQQQGKYIH